MNSFGKFSKLFLSTAITAMIPIGAYAEEHKGPNLTGALSAGVLNVDTLDSDAWAFKADLGADGIYVLDSGIKLKYELVADFAGELNRGDNSGLTWSSGDASGTASGDVFVHTARIFVITDYGMFLVAPRTISGQWAQLYRNVDKFEYNRMHSQTGDIAIFAQLEQADHVLAYLSPKFMDNWRIIAAAMTISEQNDQDVDVFAIRAVYDDGKLNAGIGNVWVSDAMLPTMEDYNRTVMTVGYDFGSFALGGTYEMNQDHPTGDWDAYAVSAELDLTDKWTATVAYAANELTDNEAVIAQLKYKVNSKAYFFMETGQYSEAVDNVAAGIHVKF